jgi:hypothetical protein
MPGGKQMIEYIDKPFIEPFSKIRTEITDEEKILIYEWIGIFAKAANSIYTTIKDTVSIPICAGVSTKHWRGSTYINESYRIPLKINR